MRRAAHSRSLNTLCSTTTDLHGRVLLETEWVLRSRYGLPKIEIIEVVSRLLDANDVKFEDEPAIEEALVVLAGYLSLIAARIRNAVRIACRTTAGHSNMPVAAPAQPR